MFNTANLTDEDREFLRHLHRRLDSILVTVDGDAQPCRRISHITGSNGEIVLWLNPARVDFNRAAARPLQAMLRQAGYIETSDGRVEAPHYREIELQPRDIHDSAARDYVVSYMHHSGCILTDRGWQKAVSA